MKNFDGPALHLFEATNELVSRAVKNLFRIQFQPSGKLSESKKNVAELLLHILCGGLVRDFP